MKELKSDKKRLKKINREEYVCLEIPHINQQNI